MEFSGDVVVHHGGVDVDDVDALALDEVVDVVGQVLDLGQTRHEDEHRVLERVLLVAADDLVDEQHHCFVELFGGGGVLVTEDH